MSNDKERLFNKIPVRFEAKENGDVVVLQ